MRRIVFRGKNTEGKWLVGSLIPKSENLVYIAPFGQPFNLKEVDPNTVGQFTGLTDREGKEIYEGDVVVLNPIIHEYWHIRWNEETAQFVVCKVDDGQWYRIDPYSIKVVGNVFDNLDLLTDNANKQ